MANMKHLPLGLSLLSCALLAAPASEAAKPARLTARNPHTQSAPVPLPRARSTWHQDSSLLQQLAPDYPMGVFSLRPPTGYTLVQKNTERETDYVSQYEWVGDARTDGSMPEMDVQITRLKPDVVTVVTLDDRLTQLLSDLQKDSPWIQSSPYQHGVINGSSFVRVYFKDGPGAPAGHPVTHGFIYKATSNDAKYLITIIAHDVEPYHTTTLPLLEASVLTFK